MTAASLQQEIIADPRYIKSFEGVTIYGVAGTNGSGKDLLMEILEQHGFYVYNTGDQLRHIARPVFHTTQRGGNQSPMGRVANAERLAYPGGLVDLGLLSWWAAIDHLPTELKPRGLVIGSLRAVGEAERLKAFGGKLIAVNAPTEVRYERLKNRGRYYEQSISFEAFLQEEKAELAEGETDPTKFGMAAVIDMADITVTNDTSEVLVFKEHAVKTLVL